MHVCGERGEARERSRARVRGALEGERGCAGARGQGTRVCGESARAARTSRSPRAVPGARCLFCMQLRTRSESATIWDNLGPTLDHLGPSATTRTKKASDCRGNQRSEAPARARVPERGRALRLDPLACVCSAPPRLTRACVVARAVHRTSSYATRCRMSSNTNTSASNKCGRAFASSIFWHGVAVDTAHARALCCCARRQAAGDDQHEHPGAPHGPP